MNQHESRSHSIGMDPINDSSAQVFILQLGEEKAVLQYRRDPAQITFLHTEVPESMRGQGIAQRLAHAGLQFARQQNLRVTVICPFVASYLKKHPEHMDLVDHVRLK